MRAGEKLRHYQLQTKLGTGGMGEVWTAWDGTLSRLVAIKVMNGSMIDTADFRARFLAEARSHAKLDHPGIPRVYDCFSDAGANCLVMQFIEGRSLESIVDEGVPLDIPIAVSIARDFLSALNYAHEQGVIHRDVKPSNIIVDGNGHAHLIDFGIALAVGEARLTRTGRFVGTLEYTSPEQIRTPRNVDHRTDVYSSGCVIYEMLTGRPPFVNSDDGTNFEIERAQVLERPKSMRLLRPSIPEALDRVVLWSLEKDVAERLPGCEEFRRLLNETFAGGPATTLVPQPRTASVQRKTAGGKPEPANIPRRSRLGFVLKVLLFAFLTLVVLVVIASQVRW